MRTAVFDTECYVDYWLFAAKNPATGGVKSFELYEGHPLDVQGLKSTMASYRLVSFNGVNYDMPMIALALSGADTATLKAASDLIIQWGVKPWEFERAHDVKIPHFDHIDLIEVAPGYMVSLKLYAGRMHSKRLQDLPLPHDAVLGAEGRAVVHPYCINDLDATIDLWTALAPQIKLREEMTAEYGIDLRSKSDAQIAEAVIKVGVGKVDRPVIPAGTTYFYKPPAWVSFIDPSLQAALRLITMTPFKVRSAGGVDTPAALAGLKIAIGNSVYRMGIGGLHSSEQRVAHHAGADHILVDRDVESFYPRIIINTKLAPTHMGKAFLDVYEGIVNRRIAAKHSGNKIVADSLKIVINASFGKLGSMYSALYSPDMLIQVTLTGQLALLMLIERLEAKEIPELQLHGGIQIVSANTDGIVIKCPKKMVDYMQGIVRQWETLTNFKTEETQYRSLYSRDVNNYVAIKPDGKTKTKGSFASEGLAKNPANQISIDAAMALIVNGTPVEQTIHECQDVRKFVTVRTVGGGAVWAGMYLGKAVRWYYSSGVPESVCIRYKSNGNKVSRSNGAMPCMLIPTSVPSDINYEWYEREAHDILEAIGH